MIPQHRAFAHLRLERRDAAGSFALAFVLTAGWLWLLRPVGWFWGEMFKFWAERLQLHAAVVMVPERWFLHFRFELPYLNLSAGAVDPRTWWTTAVVTTAVFAGSYFLPDEMLPWVYLGRSLAIIQVTALGYFAFFAARFPHDLASYTVGMLVFGAILIGLVPIILGFTHYLFDFTLSQKLALTAITMAHLTVFVPLQYLVHACIIHWSILFMPALYFAFGPFLDVLVFIAFYSWGMSWRARAQY